MKRLIFSLLLFSVFPFMIPAQTVSGVALEDIDAEYLSISGSRVFGGPLRLIVDFGQSLENQENSRFRRLVLGDDGKPLPFNSLMDGLNLMHKYGYELVESDVFAGDNPYTVLYLRKIRE